MYFYIAMACLFGVALGIILVVALTMERDNTNYRRSRTYSEFLDDEV